MEESGLVEDIVIDDIYPFTDAFFYAEDLDVRNFNDDLNEDDIVCTFFGAIYFCNFDVVRHILGHHEYIFRDRSDDESFVDMLDQCLYQLYGKRDVDDLVKKVFIDYVITHFEELWSVRRLTRPYES